MIIQLASFSSIYGFFVQGGFFMVPLLICSVVSVGVIVMRGLALRREMVIPGHIEEEIDAMQEATLTNIERLKRMAFDNDSTLARVVMVALEHLNWPKAENADAVQTKARHEIVRLESGLFLLEIVVGIAPLLGLLGAVAGLVTVFANLGASATVADPRGIAKGISEALSTTIVGLAIAIPCLIAHTFYSKKIETMAAEMETLMAQLLTKTYQNRQRKLSARITPLNNAPGTGGAGSQGDGSPEATFAPPTPSPASVITVRPPQKPGATL